VEQPAQQLPFCVDTWQLMPFGQQGSYQGLQQAAEEAIAAGSMSNA
jgi:hypothetical protein